MSSLGEAETQQLHQVIQALQLLSSLSGKEEKQQAVAFLEQFQKSAYSWSICHYILQQDTLAPGAVSSGYTQLPLDVKLFAGQTLRSKIIYDLPQVPRESLASLKDSLIHFLTVYRTVRIIRIQLSCCLAILSLQYSEWANPVDEIIEKLSQDPENLSSLLEFLKILPEEVSDIRKSQLNDEEYYDRVHVLIGNNTAKVLFILSSCVNSATTAMQIGLIYDCLGSWVSEIPLKEILGHESLANGLFAALKEPSTFDTAVDCVCALIKETKDDSSSPENLNIIQLFFSKIVELRSWLVEYRDDTDIINGLTRMFVEAGEAWYVLIAKYPKDFKPLVETLLECTAYRDDLDISKYTFYFWYLLQNVITLEKYQEAKEEFQDVYHKLVEAIIELMQYPAASEDGGEGSFENSEQADKFKDFRYEMGDVLKDCCCVLGSSNALQIPYDILNGLLIKNSNAENIPWQLIEAPLFSMRTMAREVELTENKIMPLVINLLIQLPAHEKIRYAAILVLGRYTEWTAHHPEYLELQLSYITNGFTENTTPDILKASAQALMYFCQDCSQLLTPYITQLMEFYRRVASSLPIDSLYEVTEGISYIISAIYDPHEVCKQTIVFLLPIVEKLESRVAEKKEATQEVYVAVADELELVTITLRVIRADLITGSESVGSVASTTIPESGPGAMIYAFLTRIWNLIKSTIQAFGTASIVSERSLKLLKTMMSSYNKELLPLVGEFALLLSEGFKYTHYGCYLWVTGNLVNRYSDEEVFNEITRESVWSFARSQIEEFFRFFQSSLNEKQSNVGDLSDLIEDFFRMMFDILSYFPFKLLTSDLLTPCFQVAMLGLSLHTLDPLLAVMHFLTDLVAWSDETPPISLPTLSVTPTEIRTCLYKFLFDNGQELTTRCLHGMIFNFPRDVQSDGTDVIVRVMKVMSTRIAGTEITGDRSKAVEWFAGAIKSLPEGTVNSAEESKVLRTIESAMNSNDLRRIKSSIKDFVAYYSRKNISPRSQFGSAATESAVSLNF